MHVNMNVLYACVVCMYERSLSTGIALATLTLCTTPHALPGSRLYRMVWPWQKVADMVKGHTRGGGGKTILELCRKWNDAMKCILGLEDVSDRSVELCVCVLVVSLAICRVCVLGCVCVCVLVVFVACFCRETTVCVCWVVFAFLLCLLHATFLYL